MTGALWLVPCDHRNFSTLETQQYPTLASRQKRPESAHFSRSLGGGNSSISLCSPWKLGKWSKLTNIFQMDWNHHPVLFFSCFFFSREIWTAILMLDYRRVLLEIVLSTSWSLEKLEGMIFVKGSQLPLQMFGIVWNEQSQTIHETGLSDLYIYHNSTPNVGKYTLHGWYGNETKQVWRVFLQGLLNYWGKVARHLTPQRSLINWNLQQSGPQTPTGNEQMKRWKRDHFYDFSMSTKAFMIVLFWTS